MAGVVDLVQDLFFVAKIREAAAQLGIDVASAPDPEALQRAAAGARLVFLDLRRADAVRALDLLAADPATAHVATIGFVDHENLTAMDAARAHGCGTVLTKGKFSSDLPALLARSTS